MATYKITGHDQKEYGPLTEAQLRQWLAEGRVNGATRVQAEGATEWTTLAALPEFAAAPAPLPIPATPAKTSALAVTSLILGILGFFSCGFTALIGLILGIVAMVKIKNSRGTLGGNGLALAGTIVSAIFILMIPIFAAMLLPALAAARQKAMEINCVNNEKELCLAVRIYSDQHGGHFPPAATWCDAIKPLHVDSKAFRCLASPISTRCSYAFNAKLDGLDASKINPQTVVLFESDAGWDASGGPELFPVPQRHHEIVVALADGSVQMLKPALLSTLRWDP